MSDDAITPFEPDHESDDGRVFPWAPQPGETHLGFHLFTVYRDLPAGKRSISAAARTSGRSPDTLRALSARYNWVDRALSFDAYLDQRAVESLARGRTAMRQEHTDIAIMARQKILARLKTMDPDELGARDLATWLDLSVKIERQARGEADKKIEISGEVSIVESLPTDERRSLMEEARRVLAERLGLGVADELEAFVEAEVLEDGDGGQEG